MMSTVKVPIIPNSLSYWENKSLNRLYDLKAIATFSALGFFLDDDTYYQNLKVLKPGQAYTFNEKSEVKKEKSWFQWKYEPRDISFDQIVDEVGALFERLTHENLKGKNVILPLSGGLDSRSQAAALKGWSNVNTFSYQFEHSFNETLFGKEIARQLGIPFQKFIIPNGYLWNTIEELALTNDCYSDFTHPRQMAVIEHLPAMGNIFYLGHWGDVLFDDMGVPADLSFDQQVEFLLKNIIKKGGLELSTLLWQAWGFEGTFEAYLRERVADLLSDIKIEHAGARIRAFKSLYWAPRWTSVNLSIFAKYHPVFVPYFHDEMCKFICTIPEEFLAERKIQIEYIKRKAPELASIAWQAKAPYNLYNYQKHRTVHHLPYRLKNKFHRVWKDKVQNKPLVTRNWEIQFCGEENDRKLKKWLFEQPAFRSLVPKDVVLKFYTAFKYKNAVKYSHPVSMLLTLSVFSKLNKETQL